MDNLNKLEALEKKLESLEIDLDDQKALHKLDVETQNIRINALMKSADSAKKTQIISAVAGFGTACLLAASYLLMSKNQKNLQSQVSDMQLDVTEMMESTIAKQ